MTIEEYTAIEHPETITIKNKYYPTGLKERDTHSYYMNNKSLLLDQVKGRDIMLSINTDVNVQIIRRKTQNEFLKLTADNYEKLIHGRVTTIYSTMNQYEQFGIVDIDFFNFKTAKLATIDVYKLMSQFIKPIIRFTGKTSFHVICPFKKRQQIDDIRIYLNSKLQPLSNKYSIGEYRSNTKVNLDLSINKFRGAYTTLHSLSIIGLKCMIVPPNQIERFTPEMAKIK